MSRHRDIRNMDYTDEYDGYDDVYGHSVDDDYYISPSNRQFLYNRENSRDKNIQEEDEQEAELTDTDKAKLESCIEKIQETLGPSTIPRTELIKIILKHDYNIERSLNLILEQQARETEKKEKDDTNSNLNQLIISPKFTIPKPNFNSSPKFTIPKPNFSQKFNIPKPNFPKIDLNSSTSPKATSLSEYAQNHLKTVEVNSETLLISQLKITNNSTKSLTAVNSPINTDWHVDLSKALKPTNSMPTMTKKKTAQKTSETFEIDFIDCNINPFEKQEKKQKTLTCTMDISKILNVKTKNTRKPSRFGKAFCKKYKELRPLLCKIDEILVKKFEFNTPSPDDIVLRSISRARSNK